MLRRLSASSGVASLRWKNNGVRSLLTSMLQRSISNSRRPSLRTPWERSQKKTLLSSLQTMLSTQRMKSSNWVMPTCPRRPETSSVTTEPSGERWVYRLTMSPKKKTKRTTSLVASSERLSQYTICSCGISLAQSLFYVQHVYLPFDLLLLTPFVISLSKKFK